MVIICTVILGKNKDIRVTETRKIGWELGKIIDIKTISPKVKLFTIETKKLCIFRLSKKRLLRLELMNYLSNTGYANKPICKLFGYRILNQIC